MTADGRRRRLLGTGGGGVTGDAGGRWSCSRFIRRGATSRRAIWRARCRPAAAEARRCKDHPDAPLLAIKARQAMPDIDVVTTATPPAGIEQALMFSIPDSWPPGSYVALVGGQHRRRLQRDLQRRRAPDAAERGLGQLGDGLRLPVPRPAVGRLPGSVHGRRLGSVLDRPQPEGFGSVDGTDANAGVMHEMDGTITDDPIGASGSGADRLRLAEAASYRLEVEVRECEEHMPPGSPLQLTVEPVTDPKHSHQWGHLDFRAPASGRRHRALRRPLQHQPDRRGRPRFVHSRPLPGLAASTEMDALMIPVGAAPGTTVSADFGGLSPSTHYWVAVRAVDACNRGGPPRRRRDDDHEGRLHPAFRLFRGDRRLGLGPRTARSPPCAGYGTAWSRRTPCLRSPRTCITGRARPQPTPFAGASLPGPWFATSWAPWAWPPKPAWR